MGRQSSRPGRRILRGGNRARRFAAEAGLRDEAAFTQHAEVAAEALDLTFEERDRLYNVANSRECPASVVCCLSEGR